MNIEEIKLEHIKRMLEDVKMNPNPNAYARGYKDALEFAIGILELTNETT